MRAVIVDSDLSYPANSGKRLRTLNLMLQMARRHQITYLARGNPNSEEGRRAASFLRDNGVEPILIDSPLPSKKGIRFYTRLAANLASPWPYSAASHQGAALSRAVCEHAAQKRVDLWQFEWFPHADLVADPAARRVVMAHNVESLIWQRYYEIETHPLKRWYVKQQWRKFERLERRVFAEVTQVVTVSEEDAALARVRLGAPRVEVVENGIDRSYYEQVIGPREAQRILFLGSLEWRPNLDGVRLLLDQVFPAVRAQEPAAQLIIVGRNPPLWLTESVRGREGVELHANVEDVRPYLGRSGVMTVPLRIGGGSRLKILESLASGLPVVSTRVGAEGLRLRPGHDLVVVERIEDMAAALVQCLRDPTSARTQAENGRRVVLDRYDWGGLADKLERVWEACLGEK